MKWLVKRRVCAVAVSVKAKPIYWTSIPRQAPLLPNIHDHNRMNEVESEIVNAISIHTQKKMFKLTIENPGIIKKKVQIYINADLKIHVMRIRLKLSTHIKLVLNNFYWSVELDSSDELTNSICSDFVNRQSQLYPPNTGECVKKTTIVHWFVLFNYIK